MFLAVCAADAFPIAGDEPPIRAVIPIRLAALSDRDYAAIRGLIAIRLAALCAADCAADSLPGSEANPARMCGGGVSG